MIESIIFHSSLINYKLHHTDIVVPYKARQILLIADCKCDDQARFYNNFNTSRYTQAICNCIIFFGFRVGIIMKCICSLYILSVTGVLPMDIHCSKETRDAPVQWLVPLQLESSQKPIFMLQNLWHTTEKSQ